jgi:hypothetical protein
MWLVSRPPWVEPQSLTSWQVESVTAFKPAPFKTCMNGNRGKQQGGDRPHVPVFVHDTKIIRASAQRLWGILPILDSVNPAPVWQGGLSLMRRRPSPRLQGHRCYRCNFVLPQLKMDFSEIWIST